MSGLSSAIVQVDSSKKIVDILQDQIAALRDEVKGGIETNFAIWKMGLIGVGAVVVLKSDVKLEDYPPLVPLLAITVIFLGVKQNFVTWRIGRSIALNESRINFLLVTVVLDHEICLWRRRREAFNKWRIFFAIFVVGTPMHLYLIHSYMSGSKLGATCTVSAPVYITSFLMNLLLLAEFIRLWVLFQLPTIETIPTSYPASL
jgi:hypothetical protein